MRLASKLKKTLLTASILIFAACSTTPPNIAALQEPATVKRKFVDGLYGQVHVRVSTPPNNVSQKTPLLLLHPTPYSSQFYLPFIEEIGKDRLVIAMDTPGYGDSDRPATPPTMQDYARNAIKALDELGITEPLNVMGYHTGTLIAAEMTINNSERINKVILAGTPIYSPERLPELHRKYAKPDELKTSGSHLTSKWNFATQTMKAGLSLEAAQAHYSDYMQSLPESTQAYYSVFSYPGYERIKLMSRPSLFVSINGSLKEETKTAQKLTPNSELIYLENVTTGLFDVAYPQMAKITRDYLD